MKNSLGLLLLLALLGCQQKTPPPAAADSEYPLSRLSDRTYVVHGPLVIPNKENRGFTNNPGFVVTTEGVVVIDPGSSRGVGEMLLSHIRSVTEQPVVAVFNTHVHGDHWLGNEAIRLAFPKAPIYAHPKMKQLAEAGEGKTWLDLFNKLTDGTLAPTNPVAPDHAVDNGDTIQFGGMDFKVLHTGQAHTGHDIMIQVPQQQLVFLGDNASHRRTVRLDDGSFKGNIAALDAALKTNSQQYVPGHGPSGGAEMVMNYRAYLLALRSGVATLFEQGLPDYEMKAKLLGSLTPWQSWSEFDDNLGKHISLVYLEVEKEAF